MALQDLINLASEASRKLYSLARQLGKSVPESDATRFSKELAAELKILNFWLEDLDDSPGLQSVSTNEITKLLRNLERICIYPSALTTPPARSSLAPNARRNASTEQSYPALNTLRQADVKNKALRARKGLEKLASATSDAHLDYRRDFIRMLKSFSQPQGSAPSQSGPEEGSVATTNLEVTADYLYYVKALYTTLYRNRMCGAAMNSKDRLVSKLRLSNLEEIEEAVIFRLSFLPHPHIDSLDYPVEWQESQVSVYRGRYTKTGEIEEGNKSVPRDEAIQSNEFCQLLSSVEQSVLCMELRSEELTHHGYSPRDNNAWILRYPSVPLTRILSVGGLSKSRQRRLLLSAVLARAVWQFYDSDWMIKVWTKDDIHFLYTSTEQDSTPGLYADQPFLSAELDDIADLVPAKGRSHKFPKILSLGILLLEIELDLRIESLHRREYLDANGNPNINTDSTTAFRELNNPKLWRDQENFSDHKRVIEECLKADKFDKCTSVEEERVALYKNVVAPLEKLLKDTWNDLDLNPLGPINLPMFYDTSQLRAQQLVKQTPPNTRLGSDTSQGALDFRSTQKSSDLPPADQGSINGNMSLKSISFPTAIPIVSKSQSNTSSIFKADAADAWLQKIEDMSLLLRRTRDERSKGINNKAKIAILDTGIDAGHPHWRAVKNNYKDFVTEGNKVGIDNTGHGTNGVNLLLNIMPDAEIYVGRVFDGDRATEEKSTRVAKAIVSAVRWGADIITMSIGFEEECEEVIQAILLANERKVLIFAAAANHGNLSEIAFPARMQGNVICIFSSTGRVKESKGFNPSPFETSKLNFCFLGEEVEKVSYSATAPKERKSGTSIATTIATAIAAIVIDFSRQTDCPEELILKREKLKTIPGMSAIFRKMAEGKKDNGYDCVAPWEVLDCLKLPMREWSREKKRQYIFNTIFREL